MTSDAVSRTPILVTVCTLFVLALVAATLRGVGLITDRAALGALGGLASGAAVLAVAAVVVHHRHHGGPTGE